MLSDKDKYRYGRQLNLKEVGEQGQSALQKSSVLVIGAGGLGTSILQLLVGSGIGKIGIADFDTINITNLHRQTIYHEKLIGENKAFAAKTILEKLNSSIRIEAITTKITGLNAIEIFKPYDIIIDASDNYSTRYLVNDVCVLLNKPFVFGAVYRWEGQVSVFNYKNGATYRCVFPKASNLNLNCETVGVISSVCMEIAARQVNEVFKMILDVGTVLNSSLLYVDLLHNQSYQFNTPRNEKLVQDNFKSDLEIAEFDYELNCGESKQTEFISVEHFLSIVEKEQIQLIDIRQNWEGEPLNFQNTMAVPMQDIDSAIAELDKNKLLVVVCTYGTRSMVIVDYLKLRHQFKHVVSLKGGVEALNNRILST